MVDRRVRALLIACAGAVAIACGEALGAGDDEPPPTPDGGSDTDVPPPIDAGGADAIAPTTTEASRATRTLPWSVI